MYRKAVELAKANRCFLARQLETEANARIHENTTAQEVPAHFQGGRLDYWVTEYGTSGTLTGVGRVLRRERPEIKIILTEPTNAQLLGSRHVQSLPNRDTSAFQPHPLQDWTPDFIPRVLQEGLDAKLYDELIPVASLACTDWRYS